MVGPLTFEEMKKSGKRHRESFDSSLLLSNFRFAFSLS